MIKITGSAARLVTFLFSVKDDSKLWELKEHKEKRSLNANALAWKCISEIAQAMIPPQDRWEIYLRMLRKYGVSTYLILHKNALPMAQKVFRIVDVVDDDFKVNGFASCQCLCYLGSSKYDTKQFSVFLDGIINQEMYNMDLPMPTSKEMQKSLDEWQRIQDYRGKE